mmetsp:Transcript_23675/g.56518  ORF Transcript_23675/g.56518 Transcript_23675/m.56518 type:complete len:258 (-) Transcript_23675:598-1371(-)
MNEHRIPERTVILHVDIIVGLQHSPQRLGTLNSNRPELVIGPRKILERVILRALDVKRHVIDYLWHSKVAKHFGNTNCSEGYPLGLPCWLVRFLVVHVLPHYSGERTSGCKGHSLPSLCPSNCSSKHAPALQMAMQVLRHGLDTEPTPTVRLLQSQSVTEVPCVVGSQVHKKTATLPLKNIHNRSVLTHLTGPTIWNFRPGISVKKTNNFPTQLLRRMATDSDIFCCMRYRCTTHERMYSTVENAGVVLSHHLVEIR